MSDTANRWLFCLPISMLVPLPLPQPLPLALSVPAAAVGCGLFKVGGAGGERVVFRQSCPLVFFWQDSGMQLRGNGDGTIMAGQMRLCARPEAADLPVATSGLPAERMRTGSRRRPPNGIGGERRRGKERRRAKVTARRKQTRGAGKGKHPAAAQIRLVLS